MITSPPAPSASPALSVHARRLFEFFLSEPLHWVVIQHARIVGAAHLSDLEFESAVAELEAADLVERAPYGPLLYIL
jgi:hypothetical protein